VNFQISRLTDFIPAFFLEKLITKELFARMGIASKMLLGYIVLVLLTMVVIIYTPVNLQRLIIFLNPVSLSLHPMLNSPLQIE
jgi:cytosine/uracil/thiamine/allantoin permease